MYFHAFDFCTSMTLSLIYVVYIARVLDPCSDRDNYAQYRYATNPKWPYTKILLQLRLSTDSCEVYPEDQQYAAVESPR